MLLTASTVSRSHIAPLPHVPRPTPQARKSQLSRRYRHVGEFSALRDDRAFYSDLRSSPDIHMSLLVRTNHVLPIGVMAREYERILRKRITLVGGDRQVPPLPPQKKKLKNLKKDKELSRRCCWLCYGA